MGRPRNLPVLLFLLATCTVEPDASRANSSVSVGTPQPWFAGEFAGTCYGDSLGERFEVGTGSVHIHADGTFDLHFVWAEDVISRPADWLIGGVWTQAEPPDSEQPQPDCARLDLLTLSANLNELRGRRPRVTITRADISVGFGPCVGFVLPRAR